MAHMVGITSLFFDYDYFSQLSSEANGLDWPSALELYEDKYLPECTPTNKECAIQQEKCRLDEWSKLKSKEQISELVKNYLTGEDKATKAKFVIFEQNFLKLAQYDPSSLENLLGLGDITVEGYVLKAIASNSTHQLSEGVIKYLEQNIDDYYNKKHAYHARTLSPTATILTNYITHYSKDPAHTNFLIDLCRREDFDNKIRENIIHKFAEDVSGVKSWNDMKVFDSFASLLPHDKGKHELARALVLAHQKHGF